MVPFGAFVGLASSVDLETSADHTSVDLASFVDLAYEDLVTYADLASSGDLVTSGDPVTSGDLEGTVVPFEVQVLAVFVTFAFAGVPARSGVMVNPALDNLASHSSCLSWALGGILVVVF